MDILVLGLAILVVLLAWRLLRQPRRDPANRPVVPGYQPSGDRTAQRPKVHEWHTRFGARHA